MTGNPTPLQAYPDSEASIPRCVVHIVKKPKSYICDSGSKVHLASSFNKLESPRINITRIEGIISGKEVIARVKGNLTIRGELGTELKLSGAVHSGELSDGILSLPKLVDNGMMSILRADGGQILDKEKLVFKINGGENSF